MRSLRNAGLRGAGPVPRREHHDRRNRGARVPGSGTRRSAACSNETARQFPDHDALVFPGLNLRWSWRELDRHVSHVAAALLALGVEPGEHIGIWSMNVPEWVVTQFAAGKIGAVLVNVNPAYRVHELQDALAMADVATLVVGSPFKGSNFVSMVETLCPEVAAATVARLVVSPLSSSEATDRAGGPPRPGMVDNWADLEEGPLASKSELESRAQRR